MSPAWRQLLLTVVLAGLAGFAGVWLGASRLAPPPQATPMLPSVVNELTSRGLQGLTPQQARALDDVAARFYDRRSTLRRSITSSNFELGNALAEETSMGPRTQASIERLKNAVGALQTATVEYVLELRQVLNSEQQAVFDTKVVEALMTDPP